MIRRVLRNIVQPIRRLHEQLLLPTAAKAERRRDRAGLPTADPGPERVAREGVQWLGRAQDVSISRDGGVARHFSLVNGWSASYPETTGYIVPTMLACAKFFQNESFRARAQRMLDWFVSIQLPSGGFQGGTIDAKPVVPVTFNTGQVLLGLASGVHEFGEAYRQPMCAAADWLVKTQDPDGCWRKHATPFAAPGEKAYETHVAWGLLEAARVEPSRGYAEAALANARWALSLQRANGWFDKCCLSDPSQPLSHTLGYVLRGILEAYRYCRDPELLTAARKTADGLRGALRGDGYLPGRLNSRWEGTVPWVCLTGSAQIALCWLMLYEDTQDVHYRDAAFSVNRFVRRTTRTDGPPDTRGAVKGAFPVDGQYGTYQYLNWACKFVVDANLLEIAVRERDPHGD